MVMSKTYMKMKTSRKRKNSMSKISILKIFNMKKSL